jgi:protein required for attachment to host cells
LSHPQWFLLANATRARLFARDEPDGKLQLARVFEHPQGRMKTAELGDDKAGRELSGRGFGGAAFEPRLDAHRKEHIRFAHELCEFLEQEAQRGAFGSLALFAPDPFLGELKKALGPACTKHLAAASDTDLSHVGPAELARRIDRALGAKQE